MELKINQTKVQFPYEAYNIQESYMKSVIEALDLQQNALIQSPTGTGKTLCLLCSTLAWQEQYQKDENKKIKIIYASRTHSQIKQVVHELRKTCYTPTGVIIGSRDQYCVNSVFSKFKGRILNNQCSQACKKETSSYYLKKNWLINAQILKNQEIFAKLEKCVLFILLKQAHNLVIQYLCHTIICQKDSSLKIFQIYQIIVLLFLMRLIMFRKWQRKECLI
eukprot:TRINITY_DN44414_c0_g1_i1.p1 TRINITY_DN44414_c0_g1~~TRINITY_DN44414_c0_g1_i1.p1  ORF type:complete len:221 (+),score=19.43 TRINITY_DN44414_c0_g1_i1:101-763(+)